MKRRSFLKNSLNMTIGAGATMALSGYPKYLLGNEACPDLVAIMGGEPEILFDKAIEGIGGIRRFVKPNQTVVIKPNIGWDTTPERAANTNPRLVKQMIRQCLDAGAKKVYVFDHTADAWRKCYERSGIKQAVSEANGIMVPGNSERHYHKVQVPNGKILKSVYVHELFLEADVFINVPVLKDHIATKVSLGMKNLMGVVWDRGWWHRNNLHQCIADFATYRIPDFTVIDAYRVLKTNGPTGVSNDDAVTMKALLITRDPVAADTAATKLFGRNPADIRYIETARDFGIGTMDLSSLNIRKIRI